MNDSMIIENIPCLMHPGLTYNASFFDECIRCREKRDKVIITLEHAQNMLRKAIAPYVK